MEIKEILSRLEYNTGTFPYEALEEAIEKKDEIIPELLKILENTEKNIESIKKEPDYFSHIYSMFLLAQFREKRAYPLIKKLFSHLGDIIEPITGDFTIESLPRVLASICHGDLGIIKEFIENKDIYEYVRSAGLKALVILVVNGLKTRNEIMIYFKSLFRGKLEREPSFIWSSLVSCSCDLYPKEIYEDILHTYQEWLVEPDFISLKNVQHYLAMGLEANLERLKKSRRYKLIDNTIECMEWWACFKPEEEVVVTKFTDILDEAELPVELPPLKRWKPNKIGRNEPCPCGSCKKYKKCCGSYKKR